MSKDITALDHHGRFRHRAEPARQRHHEAGTPESGQALAPAYPAYHRSALAAWTWACRTARWATLRSATLNIGAGRIVYQELTRITKAIQDGDFFEKSALFWTQSTTRCDNGGDLHLMGLLSDGGVHSHNTHLYASAGAGQAAAAWSRSMSTALLDGRDVPPVLRQGLCAGSCAEKLKRNRRGQNRHGHGPLLCDGPRQPLGSRGEGLCTPWCTARASSAQRPGRGGGRLLRQGA